MRNIRVWNQAAVGKIAWHIHILQCPYVSSESMVFMLKGENGKSLMLLSQLV